MVCRIKKHFETVIDTVAIGIKAAYQVLASVIIDAAGLGRDGGFFPVSPKSPFTFADGNSMYFDATGVTVVLISATKPCSLPALSVQNPAARQSVIDAEEILRLRCDAVYTHKTQGVIDC